MSCDCFEQWFDLTVTVKLCQGNSFWKHSEFIFKQGKLKKNVRIIVRQEECWLSQISQ